jgi:hypothetical protein
MLEISLAAAALLLTVFQAVSAAEPVPARAVIPRVMARNMRKDA